MTQALSDRKIAVLALTVGPSRIPEWMEDEDAARLRGAPAREMRDPNVYINREASSRNSAMPLAQSDGLSLLLFHIARRSSRSSARFKPGRPPLERIANADNRRLIGRQHHDIDGTQLFNRYEVFTVECAHEFSAAAGDVVSTIHG